MMNLFEKMYYLEIPTKLPDSFQGQQETSLQVWKALIQEFNNIWSQIKVTWGRGIRKFRFAFMIRVLVVQADPFTVKGR